MDELNLPKADYPFPALPFCPFLFSPWCINIARLLHNARPALGANAESRAARLAGIVILCVLLQRAPKELHGVLSTFEQTALPAKRSFCSECSFVLKYTSILRMWNWWWSSGSGLILALTVQCCERKEC